MGEEGVTCPVPFHCGFNGTVDFTQAGRDVSSRSVSGSLKIRLGAACVWFRPAVRLTLAAKRKKKIVGPTPPLTDINDGGLEVRPALTR